jgi:RNA polymerase sigma factor (sigma-70 family)
MMRSTLQSHDVWVEEEVPNADGWVQVDGIRRSGEKDGAFDAASDATALENDNLVAEYFGELRRFDLLNWEEETALWQRIEHWKIRARRALYTSPVALTTLRVIWQKVEAGKLSLDHMVTQVDAIAHEQTATHVQVARDMRHLSDLSVKLRSMKRQQWRLPSSKPELQTRRQERAGVWRDWLSTWEGMRLHANVHEAMRQALDRKWRASPGEPAIRAAHQGWNRAQRELEQAKAQMLCANLRLVVYVAKKYRDQGVLLLDLIQEGNIGLMRAIDRFEPERGLKFVTYAHWWVRQAISRSVIEQRATVRLPSYVVERQQKLRAASDRLYHVHGRLPTSQELSDVLGWTPKEIERLRGRRQVVLRLHESFLDDGRKLEEVVEDDRVLPLEAQMEKREIRRFLARCLASLTEREAQILRLRFGLENGRSHNLREIGERLGLSHERIRQIERLALEKLRVSECGGLIADLREGRA